VTHTNLAQARRSRPWGLMLACALVCALGVMIERALAEPQALWPGTRLGLFAMIGAASGAGAFALAAMLRFLLARGVDEHSQDDDERDHD